MYDNDEYVNYRISSELLMLGLIYAMYDAGKHSAKLTI